MLVTVLTYLEKEDDPKHDPVVDQVAEALTAGGYEVRTLGVHGDVQKLVAGLSEPRPDLVFNLAEMFGRNVRADVCVAGALELLDLPYTGSGPTGLALCQDKALCKKVLDFHGLKSPGFIVFGKDSDLETAGNLRLPLFVKPLTHDASIGIDARSVVRDAGQLVRKVAAIHEKLDDDALAEEFIDGRELFVGVLGHREPLVLPPIEVDYSGLPPGAPRIFDTKAKWAKRSKEYKGTKCVLAELDPTLRARIAEVVTAAWRALGTRDYGRVDLRVADTGDIHILEVNPNCYLEKKSEFAMAAAAGGIEFVPLVQRIAAAALQRAGLKPPEPPVVAVSTPIPESSVAP